MKNTAPLSPVATLRIVLIAASVTVFSLVGLNLVVDPYGVRPSGAFLRLPLKSRQSIEKNEYLHKAYALKNERPETVYFGNSHVCVGLPADDAVWHSKVYNCGLTSAGPEEILAYLRHALSIGGVKRVVLGFDGVNFLGPPWQPPTFDGSLLLTQPGTHMRPAFACPGIFSFGAVLDSLRTLMRQAGANVVTYRNGVRDSDAMRAKIKGDSGWASELVMEAGRAQFRALAAIDRAQDGVRVQRAREMAELCRQHGVGVTILFLPIHHAYEELLIAEGLRERVRAMEKQVQAAFENAGLPVLAVHDFAQGHPLAIDDSPETDGSKVGKWWWEVSHFRAELGGEMLKEIGGRRAAATQAAVAGMQ